MRINAIPKGVLHARLTQAPPKWSGISVYLPLAVGTCKHYGYDVASPA